MTFARLAVTRKVSTADNLRRRAFASKAISDLCVMCRKGRETVDHLFVHCEFAHSLWCRLLVQCGIFWCSPRSLTGMQSHRQLHYP